jgi:hypothetical protein
MARRFRWSVSNMELMIQKPSAGGSRSVLDSYPIEKKHPHQRFDPNMVALGILISLGGILILLASTSLEEDRGQELHLHESWTPLRGPASPLMAMRRRSPENRRLIAKDGFVHQSCGDKASLYDQL